jgi:hypothetical protein
MQIRLRAIATLLCLLNLAAFRLHGQQVTSVPQLFEQLQSEKTTDQATSQFLKPGPGNVNAKSYLAPHLPVIISQKPKNHYVWLNSVRLAGTFRITEAIPALIKWINAAAETGGTLAENNRLDSYPCAKALVQIGEPAVPALIETLEKGDSRHQWFACRVLFMIGTPRAIDALRNHINHEPNPDFKREIQRALDRK